MTSYYRQINGRRYERRLLELAEEPGAITTKRAKALIDLVVDAGRFTEIERQTIRLIVRRFRPLSDAAERVLGAFVVAWPSERTAAKARRIVARESHPEVAKPAKKRAKKAAAEPAPKKRSAKAAKKRAKKAPKKKSTKKRAKKTTRRSYQGQGELF